VEVSPNALRKDTVQLLQEINQTLKQVELDDGLIPLKRTELIVPLLLAKAQCIHTLTLLRDQEGRLKRGR
jgi:hypothetical protein